MYKYLLYLVLSLPFFALLYYEETQIGPIRISHLWKAILYLLILLLIFSRVSRKQKVDKFVFVGILLSISSLLHVNLSQLNIADVNFAIELMTIPIFFYVFRRYFTYEKLELVILFLSSFFIVSNLPFILGFLEQPGRLSDIERYGVIGGYALSGLFFSISVSSKIFAISSVIIFGFKDVISEKFSFVTWFLLFMFSIYCVLFSFARTGWVIFIVGLFSLLFLGYRYDIKKFFILTLLILSSSAIIINQYADALQNRFLKINVDQTSQAIDYNRMTSGRLSMVDSAFIVYKNMSFEEKFLGVGNERTRSKIGLYHGSDLVPHNKILQILLQGGVTTLVIFVVYLFFLIKLCLKYFRNSPIGSLPVVLLIMYILAMLPSHGIGIYSSILFSAVLVYSMKPVVEIK